MTRSTRICESSSTRTTRQDGRRLHLKRVNLRKEEESPIVGRTPAAFSSKIETIVSTKYHQSTISIDSPTKIHFSKQCALNCFSYKPSDHVINISIMNGIVSLALSID